MPIKWPWERSEKRSYTSDILAAVFQYAATKASDAGKTAAVEAGAGFVSRSMAGAKIGGPEWAKTMLSPMVMSQIGRGLIRRGNSVWEIGTDHLLEAGYWNFEHGGPDRDSWRCRITANGPHSTRTRVLGYDAILFFAWGHDPAVPWAPSGPLQFASLTASLVGNSEEALSHDAATQVSSIVEVPSDGWSDKKLKGVIAKIKNAKGRIFFTDVLKSGDRTVDPDSPWKQRRIGPTPDAVLAEIQRDSFQRTLAAMGIPYDLFSGHGNSQGQKEAARRAQINLILPVTRMIEHEMQTKLDPGIRIKHDKYFTDMVGRAQVVEKLTAAGVAMNIVLDAVEIVDDEPD
ncbi:MAG: hypothetical protein OXI17_10050 [Gammaproteobacteria bacterium]|nr:hypothetical protein [Gammaproteobacteria bacterium]